ncbi:hypothetical protein [Nonomuraea glycinis]|uniref:hypothetical protein n=1 Tax=Nonomuraea glycinis TaxID=2047744 RepID=UPI002E0D8B8C|nr:hypothetical protein OHA68_15645 [Nonomuraea glycinis]
MHQQLAEIYRQTRGRAGAGEPIVMTAGDDIVDPAHLLTCLRAGAVRYPYFRLRTGGGAGGEIAARQTRVVTGGMQVAGFADVETIERELDAGAFLQFSRLAHWHRHVREVVTGLGHELGSAVDSRLFLARRDGATMALRTEHPTFLIQVRGQALLDGVPRRRGTAVLDSGRALLLSTPAGLRAEVRDESCLLLLAVREPMPADYAKVLKTCALTADARLTSHFHLMSQEERSAAAKQALMDVAARMSADKLSTMTATMMRQEAG